MDNNILLHEISAEEQYELVGGDWLTGAMAALYGVALLGGMFGAPPILLFLIATAGITSDYWLPND